MAIKAFIYDIDGTILNTFDQNVYPLQKIVKEVLNQDLSYDALVPYMSHNGHDVLKQLGIEHVHYDRWVQYVNAYPHEPEIFDGFLEVIETLDQANFPQGLVSSKRRMQYNIDFGQKNLKHYFKHTVMADDTHLHKPHPEPLLKCIHAMGFKPEEVVYVGDSYFDYLCSKNAGCQFALATWGNLSRDGMDDIDYILETPLDLLKIETTR